MNNGGDAAEQVVRLSLEGFEVAALTRRLNSLVVRTPIWKRAPSSRLKLIALE